MIFDRDLLSQSLQFRSSLHVFPPPTEGYSPSQLVAREARTNDLWEGYRRVYFGEVEPEPSHEQTMDRLRTEIEEHEQRAARFRLDQRGDIAPSGLLSRRDDDDGPPPSENASAPGPMHLSSECNDGGSSSTTNADSNQNNNGRANDNAADALALSCLPDASPVSGFSLLHGVPRKFVLLSQRVLRRVLAAKESIFKFGTFVPKNDRQADSSPEAPRWKAGRDLEWFRLGLQNTFDGDWTWDKVHASFPEYRRTDIGFIFMCMILNFLASIASG
jgi:hypothetical protein